MTITQPTARREQSAFATENDSIESLATSLADSLPDPRMPPACAALEEFREAFWAAIVERWKREKLNAETTEDPA